MRLAFGHVLAGTCEFTSASGTPASRAVSIIQGQNSISTTSPSRGLEVAKNFRQYPGRSMGA